MVEALLRTAGDRYDAWSAVRDFQAPGLRNAIRKFKETTVRDLKRIDDDAESGGLEALGGEAALESCAESAARFMSNRAFVATSGEPDFRGMMCNTIMWKASSIREQREEESDVGSTGDDYDDDKRSIATNASKFSLLSGDSGLYFAESNTRNPFGRTDDWDDQRGARQPLLGSGALNSSHHQASGSGGAFHNISFMRKLGYASFNFAFFGMVIPLIFVVLPVRITELTGPALMPVHDDSKDYHRHHAIGTGSALGITMMSGNVALCFLAPFVGRASDAAGPRWRWAFVVAGALLSATGLVGLTYAPTLPLFVTAFTLVCFSVAVFLPSYCAMIPDLLGDGGSHGSSSGDSAATVVNTGGQIGGLAGAVSGLFLPLKLVCFGWAGMTILCSLVSISCWPRPPPTPDHERAKAGQSGGLLAMVKSMASSLRLRPFRLFLCAVFLLAAGDTAFSSFLEFYIQDVTRKFDVGSVKIASAKEAASVFTVVNATFSIVGAVLGKFIMTRFNKRVAFLSAAVCMSAGAASNLFQGPFWSVALAGSFYGTGYGMSMTTEWAFVAELVPQGGAQAGVATYAADAALWNSVMLFPKIFVPFLYGSIIDSFTKHDPRSTTGFLITYGLAGLQFLLAGLVILAVKTDSNSNNNKNNQR